MDNEHAVLIGCDTMDDMAEIKQHVHNLQAESSELHDARLFNEINLLRLEGFYFCLDPKDALRRKNEKYEFLEIIRRRKTEIEKRPVIVVPNPIFGYPSILVVLENSNVAQLASALYLWVCPTFYTAFCHDCEHMSLTC